MHLINIHQTFHDIEREEVMPRSLTLPEHANPFEYLYALWQRALEAAKMEDELIGENTLDLENCWIHEEVAQIAWTDGDITEYCVTQTEKFCDVLRFPDRESDVYEELER